MVTNFHQLHERLYTYNLPHQTVELVNLRVTATRQPAQADFRSQRRSYQESES